MAGNSHAPSHFVANGFSDEATNNEPINIKCILLGDSGVGKTSLVVSYTTNDYPQHHKPSALDTFYVEVNADNRRVRLQICDAGGGEEASSLRHLFYPGVHVILLCFSVVQPETFRALRARWIKELADSCLVVNTAIKRLMYPKSGSLGNRRARGTLAAKCETKIRSGKDRDAKCSPVVLLVGCACDLRNDIGRLLELSRVGEKPVDQATAEELATELGAEAYVECSALTQKNLKTVFDLAIWCGLRVVDSGGSSREILNSDGYINGHGSLPSLGSLTRSSQTHNHSLPRIGHSSKQSQDSSTRSSKSDKSLWRKFLCMS